MTHLIHQLLSSVTLRTNQVVRSLNIHHVSQTNQSLFSGKNVEDPDQELVHRLFSSVGLTLEAEEKHLDAIVGLSGSAPAYVS